MPRHFYFLCLTLTLLLATGTQAFAQALAVVQLRSTSTKMISEPNKVSLKSLLDQLETNFAIRFNYRASLVRSARVSARPLAYFNDGMTDQLNQLLAPLELVCVKIDAKTFVIREKKPLRMPQSLHIDASPSGGSDAGGAVVPQAGELKTPETKAVPDRVVTGKVTDAVSGEELPGVNVLLKGTQQGTTTDVNGNFRLAVPNDGAVLVFSFVGYLSQEAVVGNRTSIEVSLKVDVKNLEEVVVVGYGEVRKADLTGSVGTVSVADMQKAPVASFDQALAGRIAGVQVSASDGQPGIGMNIVVRGANSLTQSNMPLYVIDGFPIENPENLALNPTEIESLTVLKDASATAIYGARGANGVIVIETKKGKEGKTVVDFNTSVGFQQVQKKMEMMSPYDFVKYQTELYPSVAQERYFTDGKTLESYRNAVGIEWQDHIFRRAPMHIHDIAVRGGSARTKVSISGSAYNQEGVIRNSSLKRYQGRAVIDHSISNKIKTGININYSNVRTSGARIADGAGSNVTTHMLYRAWRFRPVTGTNMNLLEEDMDPDNNNINDIRINPVLTNNNEYSVRNNANLMANAHASYLVMPGLTFKSMVSFNTQHAQFDNFYNSNTVQGTPLNIHNIRGVNGSIDHSFVRVLSNENLLTYNKSIRRIHSISALAGFSLQGISTTTNGLSVQDVPNEELGIQGLDEGIPYATRSTASENKLASFFGRVNYNYKSRYLLTATFRGDGSSKLAPGNKWKYFPSFALAWNMLRESEWLSLPQVVSQSKLRVSYGTTGNNRIGDFDYLSRLSLPSRAGYSFQNALPSRGIIPSNVGNETLKWEVTRQWNLGYDLGLFKDRAELVVDVYQKTTSDLLLQADLPLITGYVNAFKNIGATRNRGLEIALSTVNYQSSTFNWSTRFNISFNQNKVLELVGEQEARFDVVPFIGSFSNPLYVARVGHPVGMFHGLIFDGVYQFDDFDNPSEGVYTLKNTVSGNGSQRSTIRPGDIKYRDLNGDGEINTFDMTVIGRGQPVHTGGFANDFSYKGLSLHLFFQWSYGNDVYNANRLLMEGNVLNYRDHNQFASYNDRWTPENPTNKNFRAGGQGPNSFHSSRVLEDGSFLRLKTVSLSYSIPASLISKAYLTRLNVFLSAQNLITWTGYSGMDPETSVRNPVLMPGFDYSAYPISRTFTIGLNASF